MLCCRKARRKERDGEPAGDPKLYLQEALLERKLPELDMRQLVELPHGLDYNEWLASHSEYRLLRHNTQRFPCQSQLTGRRVLSFLPLMVVGQLLKGRGFYTCSFQRTLLLGLHVSGTLFE